MDHTNNRGPTLTAQSAIDDKMIWRSVFCWNFKFLQRLLAAYLGFSVIPATDPFSLIDLPGVDRPYESR